MKLLLSMFLAFGMAQASFVADDIRVLNHKKLVPVEEIEAYESDENEISVDIDGYLPNECYGDPKVRVRKGHYKNKIFVKVFSRVSHRPCAQVIKPYSITANLGTYPDGTWTVVVQRGTEWEMRDSVVLD